MKIEEKILIFNELLNDQNIKQKSIQKHNNHKDKLLNLSEKSFKNLRPSLSIYQQNNQNHIKNNNLSPIQKSINIKNNSYGSYNYRQSLYLNLLGKMTDGFIEWTKRKQIEQKTKRLKKQNIFDWQHYLQQKQQQQNQNQALLNSIKNASYTIISLNNSPINQQIRLKVNQKYKDQSETNNQDEKINIIPVHIKCRQRLMNQVQNKIIRNSQNKNPFDFKKSLRIYNNQRPKNNSNFFNKNQLKIAVRRSLNTSINTSTHHINNSIINKSKLSTTATSKFNLKRPYKTTTNSPQKLINQKRSIELNQTQYNQRKNKKMFKTSSDFQSHLKNLNQYFKEMKNYTNYENVSNSLNKRQCLSELNQNRLKLKISEQQIMIKNIHQFQNKRSNLLKNIYNKQNYINLSQKFNNSSLSSLKNSFIKQKIDTYENHKNQETLIPKKLLQKLPRQIIKNKQVFLQQLRSTHISSCSKQRNLKINAVKLMQ